MAERNRMILEMVHKQAIEDNIEEICKYFLLCWFILILGGMGKERNIWLQFF